MNDTIIPVFDLGGVFVDWNPMYLFRKLFESEEDALWFHQNICTGDWNLEFDAGEIYAEGVAKLIQTLIAVSVATDGKATVLWAARYSGGKLSTTVPEYPKGKVYNLPKEMTAIASGQTVIAAETSYLYPPLTGVVFNSAVDFRRSALFMPRFGGVIDLL